ncbi:TPA: DUF262 domain-containing protein [Bacillus cereus]|uniref:DUF262 domain-containing protein n=1 Tax=Bacillus cereus group TaxID=86661 RepID=UPI0014839FDE|nr:MULTISPECIES: DUF262 domain-containing protein [Bacillus cereus group]MBJ7939067.1 DUF262 domain-containing protein [Bacillus cereus]MDW3039678.1 DUF262 domain-containing protein [Bacillus pacificus]HDR4733094.1 DUF262 domain-containing protein [Bacillus cereus]HDR4760512.1 DUF262 domain-containing protein [Bacillus cereus]HDR4777445.1 DUF262 domain-containing protein [Bacillus cereus]
METKILNYNVYELWKYYQEDMLKVNAGYQRRDVWLKKDKVRLIESLLIGSIVPEIYLWENRMEDSISYEIIDGQQRLKGIFEYISDAPFKLEKRWLEFPESEYANLTFEQLDSENKNKIYRYQLLVRVISNIENDEIVKLFSRLNSTSYSLNPQELRNADFNGEFLRLSERIADLDFWNKYNVFSKNDSRRMKDIEFCSSLLIFLRQGFQTESQALITGIYDRYNDSYPEAEEDLDKIMSILLVIDEFLKVDDSFSKNKVHLYTLFTLAYWFLENGVEINNDILKSFEAFCNYYKMPEDELEAQDLSEEYLSNLLDYKSASLEGTKSKMKRFRRFEKLRQILCSEI